MKQDGLTLDKLKKLKAELDSLPEPDHFYIPGNMPIGVLLEMVGEKPMKIQIDDMIYEIAKKSDISKQTLEQGE